MKTHSERLVEYLNTTEGQARFVEWASNDFTQLVIMAAREACRPRALINPDATAALYELGRSTGANEVVDFFSQPRSGAQDMLDKLDALVPDYGSREILRKGGYDADT